jgi:hypothetical protein
VAVKAISEGLFTWPDEEPALIGGRCPDCAAVATEPKTALAHLYGAPGVSAVSILST